MADAKKTIFMVVGGCGCLIVLVAVALVAAGYMGFMAVDSGLEESGFGGIEGISETLDGLAPPNPDSPGAPGAPGAAAGGDGSEGGADGVTAKMNPDDIDGKLLAAEAKKPFTAADADEYAAMIRAIETSDAFERMTSGMNGLERADDKKGEKKGVLAKLGEARGALDTYSGMRDVVLVFDGEVKNRGGYQAYYGRLLRVAGLVVAAKKHAVGGDPASDATAKALLEKQPEMAAESKKALAELEKVSKSNDPAALGSKQTAMATFMKPDSIALGTFPKASFENWSKLGAKKRAELIELHERKTGAWGFFAASNLTRGDALVVFSGMHQLERFKPASQK